MSLKTVMCKLMATDLLHRYMQAGPPQMLRVSMNMKILSKKSWHDIVVEDPKMSAQISERVLGICICFDAVILLWRASCILLSAGDVCTQLPVLKAAKLGDAVGKAAAKGDVQQACSPVTLCSEERANASTCLHNNQLFARSYGDNSSSRAGFISVEQKRLSTQVVAAAVEHAMEATRGHRDVHALYEGNPESAGSMLDAGPTGRSHLAEAKAAAEARGEHIFAKPDHLGIQVSVAAQHLLTDDRLGFFTAVMMMLLIWHLVLSHLDMATQI